MFGIYRYVLALLVMHGHLVLFFDGTWSWLGVYAVVSFFSLSGYLMTLVLHERYGFTGRGLAHYLANRALRIYPPYWVALLVALVVAAGMPVSTRLLDTRIGVPAIGDWWRHLLILGLHLQVSPVLIPPAWSLHVEVAFYLLMACGLARSRGTVAAWVLAAAAWATYAVAAGWDANSRYPTIAGGALPFSLGAMGYFLRSKIRFSPALRAVLIGTTVVTALGAVRLWGTPFLGGFYLHCVLGAALVVALAQIDARAVSPWLRALDRHAGDVAYSIFLLHYSVAILLIAVIFGGTRPPAWRLFWVALPAVHLAAWLVHRLVEAPVEALRRRVREH